MGAEVPGQPSLKHPKSLIEKAPGIPGRMTREDVPDEVPVADALEQDREHSEPVPDAEAAVTDQDGPPLEAADPDWQEQREAVTDDLGLDEFDRENRDDDLPG
jgi:hypothetical protein